MFTPTWASSSSSLRLDQGGDGVDQGDATARDDAFFNGRTGGREGIFDTVLLFLQLGFGCRADTDNRNAARKLGQTLLKFFLVVIAGALVDFDADLLDAALNLRGIALPTDDRGVVFGDDDLLGAAQVG